MQPSLKSYSLNEDAISTASERSILLNLSETPKKSNSLVCHICLKKLNTFTRKRRHCRVCGNSVCSDDSEKRYVQDNLMRMCSKCVQDSAKREVQQQLLAKVKAVKDRCEEVKELIKVDYNQASEATGRIKSIEYEIEKADSAHLSSIAIAACRIQEEEERGKKLRETLENLQTLIDEVNTRERDLYDLCIEKEGRITHYKSEMQALKSESAELEAQIKLLEPRVKLGISVAEGSKTMCGICQKRMEFSSRTPGMGSIIEESSMNSSMSEYLVGRPTPTP